MAWSRFHYWRRGKGTKDVPTSKPKNFKGTLLEYQIEKGGYDPSPYFKMIDQEWARLDKEDQEYKLENPHQPYFEYQEWYRERKRVYNTRVRNLEKAHFEHEERVIPRLRMELKKEFGKDVWKKVLEYDLEDIQSFYHKYRELAKGSE